MPTEAPAIDLHQFAPALGVPNASPFCMKLETWLRMVDIPYRAVRCMNPGKGPKGKLPFIVLDGKLIGDSELIIGHLAGTRGHANLVAYAQRMRKRYFPEFRTE